MSFVADSSLDIEMGGVAPDRTVELGAGAHQTRPAPLSVGPGPECQELSGCLDHEGPGEDWVARKMLRPDPMVRTEHYLSGDYLSRYSDYPGDLPHPADRQKSLVEVDESDWFGQDRGLGGQMSSSVVGVVRP